MKDYSMWPVGRIGLSIADFAVDSVFDLHANK